ncbi:Leucine-rich repeat [Dillenia turbinata]|uniref:Leucine-rich repeat n=1 Tax=Dillenia turbinata TaxID=194707 RepID=A0AAN8W8H8_9MAGN
MGSAVVHGFCFLDVLVGNFGMSCGDDDFYVDIYCPPSKRSKIGAPFTFGENVSSQEQEPSINVLPDECLFEIFRRLPGSERSSCACVSKHWLMLVSNIAKTDICRTTSTLSLKAKGDANTSSTENGVSYNDVDMISGDNEDAEVEYDGHLTRCLEGKKATDVRLAAMAVGTANLGGLSKLLIKGCKPIVGVTDLGMSAIARGCPSLRDLSLWNLSSVTDESLVQIARGCSMLEKLDLSHCPLISSKGLIAIAKSCPNLTYLSIEACPMVENESLQAIGKGCPKLQSISIKDCPLVGDNGIAGLVSSASALRRVKLQKLNISDFSLAVIGHYGKAITNLSLSSLHNVSEKGFWVMGNAKGLQALSSLIVTSCGGITDMSLESMGIGCSNLRQLFLSKCWLVSDNGLAAFSKVAEHLESLHLEECNRITQLGMVSAVSNCRGKLKSLALVKCRGVKDMDMDACVLSPCNSLRSLTIRNCPGFGSSSLAMVGKVCPQLENLDLSGLLGITDSGLLPIIEGNEAGLVQVNLSGCLNLTDEVVLAISRLHGETLEVLNLDGCRKVTDLSLPTIADCCLFLRDLDLSNCAISDSGIAALADGEKLHLQVLSLSGCSKISNRSLPFLTKLGMTLLGLNLLDCGSVSSSTLESLMGSLWRCDILC